MPAGNIFSKVGICITQPYEFGMPQIRIDTAVTRLGIFHRLLLVTPSASSPKVTLTAEEREIARLNGITEIEYAKQKLKLQELKKNGHYNEGVR